jgi:large conductance mechanosensitive channel
MKAATGTKSSLTAPADATSRKQQFILMPQQCCCIFYSTHHTNEENEMIKGFRDFIMRGNVLDLAVAVIIGAAFTAIVNSFVTNVLTPLIATLVGKPDFAALVLYLHGGKINYGVFLNSVISFLLQAAVVYFVIVVPINYVMKQLKGKPPVADPTEKTCVQCKSLVPITATRCKFCTQPI